MGYGISVHGPSGGMANDIIRATNFALKTSAGLAGFSISFANKNDLWRFDQWTGSNNNYWNGAYQLVRHSTIGCVLAVSHGGSLVAGVVIKSNGNNLRAEKIEINPSLLSQYNYDVFFIVDGLLKMFASKSQTNYRLVLRDVPQLNWIDCILFGYRCNQNSCKTSCVCTGAFTSFAK